MDIRYPPPLKVGDLVVVTAPSSGVEAPLHPRLDLTLAHLRSQGFRVEEGRCLRQETRSASAPATQRAAELMQCLLRDDVAAIIPPWGGELAIEILDLLDWQALAATRPKWLLGFSDTSTWMLPITLRLGWATAHGPCLMDMVAGQADPLTRQAMSVLSTPTAGSVQQLASSHWQMKWTDFAAVPDTTYQLTEPTHWRSLQGDAHVAFEGRLVGGCLDTLMHLAGTTYGDVARFMAAHRPDGTVLYLENAGLSPTDWVRALHRLRWAGWLDTSSGLAGVMIGRSLAPDTAGASELRYEEALQSTLGTLACPVLVDVDIGHRPPQLVLINGALAQVSLQAGTPGQVTQRFA